MFFELAAIACNDRFPYFSERLCCASCENPCEFEALISDRLYVRAGVKVWDGLGWFGVVVVMRGLREELGACPELPSIRVEGAGLSTGRPRAPNAVCVVDA